MLPKPYIDVLALPVHGGLNYSNPAKDSQLSRKMLDFSTCCNPYPIPGSINTITAGANLKQYPDPNSSVLRNKLASILKVNNENIIVGNGSTELIRMAYTAYFNSEDTVIILSPTYGEYELAGRIANTRIIKYNLSEKNNFQLDIDPFITFAKEHNPCGIFLCNPNNPTGQYIERNELLKLAESFPDSLVIVDEAYISFVNSSLPIAGLLKHSNILIIRSMTKDYAIAGIRLGYAVASHGIITALTKVRPPWNVNSLAQLTGIHVLDYQGHLAKSMLKIHNSRNYLMHALSNLGFSVLPSDANFFIFKVGNARHFQEQLIEKGFLVRDCTSFGLPGYVRIAPKNREDCFQLIKAIKQVRE